MRSFLLCTLLLLPLPVWGFETLVGSKVWLPKNNAIRHFNSDSSFAKEEYGLKEAYFVVKEEVLASRAFPLYRVTTASGGAAFLFKAELEKLTENLGVYVHPPGTIPEDYERELAENRKKWSLRIKPEQIKVGIQKKLLPRGQAFALRRPLYGMPGLSMVKLESVEVKADGSTLVKLNTPAGAIEEQFRNPEDVETFLTTSLYKTPPKWEKAVIEAIKVKKLLPGMTKEQVVASWGAPDDFNRTITKKTSDEQWFYGTTAQLYFENDHLMGWKE